MDHPLTGFTRKLNRADKHLQDIKGLIGELADLEFYDLVTELDYKRRPVARFRSVRQPDPLRTAPLLIGDCLYNFRSALDQLAYQLAVAHWKPKPLPSSWAKSSAFPIFNSGKKYRRKGSPGAAWKMRGMSRFARGAIERVQPYHRRKEPFLQMLWFLEELCNIDKHRLIHVTAAAPYESEGWVENLNASGRIGLHQFAGPIEEGAKFMRVLGDLPAPAEVQVKSKITPTIIFDKRTELRAVQGLYVVPLLQNIRLAIWLYVVENLSAEIARLFDARLQVTLTDADFPEPLPPMEVRSEHA